MTRSSLNSSRSFRLPTALVATGLAAVLVGCGGGSSSTSKTGEEQTVTTAQQQAITRASAAYSAAQKSVAALAVTATPQQRLTAYRAVQKTADDLVKALEASGDTTSQEYKDAMVASSDAKMNVEKLEKQIADAAAEDKAAEDKAAKVAAASSAAQTATNAVTKALSALNSAETPTQDQVDAVNDAVAKLQTAIKDPNLPATEKTAHETTISAAQGTATSAQGKIDAAKMDAKKTAQNNKTQVWRDAIDDYDVASTASGMDANDDDNYPSAISNLDIKTGNKVDIRLSDDEGIRITDKNVLTDAPSGWSATRFTIKKDESRGVVVSNAKQDKTQTKTYDYDNVFYSEYNTSTNAYNARTVNTNQTDDGAPLDLSKYPAITGIAENKSGKLSFGSQDINKHSTKHFASLPKSVALNATANRTQTITYLGVQGTYACPGTAACTVEGASDGGEFTISGEPTFTPKISDNQDASDIEVKITSKVVDSEYVSYGYWLTTNTKASKHTIDTFVMPYSYTTTFSNTGTNHLEQLRVLKGKATYDGSAAGVYVIDTGDDLWGQGEFFAEVELTAQFGESGTQDLRDSEAWLITGTIDGFDSNTSPDHDLSDWKLSLSADFGSRSSDGSIGTGTATWELGDATTTSDNGKNGEWNALFYTDTSLDTNANTGADNYPEAIAGEFKGHFSNGSVVGAFGAEKD